LRQDLPADRRHARPHVSRTPPQWFTETLSRTPTSPLSPENPKTRTGPGIRITYRSASTGRGNPPWVSRAGTMPVARWAVLVDVRPRSAMHSHAGALGHVEQPGPALPTPEKAVPYTLPLSLNAGPAPASGRAGAPHPAVLAPSGLPGARMSIWGTPPNHTSGRSPKLRQSRVRYRIC
jgi:hypothetical protein